MEWTDGQLRVTDDPAAIDFDFICEHLKTTYWAEGRSREKIERSWRAAIPFTMFERAERIGFARAVTDRSTFSWIADVFVHPDHRGHGAGQFLMRCVTSHPDIAIAKICLATRDAHAFYEKLGFARGDAMWKRPPHAPPCGQ